MSVWYRGNISKRSKTMQDSVFPTCKPIPNFPQERLFCQHANVLLVARKRLDFLINFDLIFLVWMIYFGLFIFASEEAPESYWKVIAERRREALAEALQENEQVKYCYFHHAEGISSWQRPQFYLLWVINKLEKITPWFDMYTGFIFIHFYYLWLFTTTVITLDLFPLKYLLWPCKDEKLSTQDGHL